jgi:oxygen-independent coproporphyrinogen III oxidase
VAGIYIHIPFCRKACRYCDFHFNVSLVRKQEMVKCIMQEINDRKQELYGELIETIYFGGGTPSVLDDMQIKSILSAISMNHNVLTDAEISFEANPDDLNVEYLKMLKENGINRLSIGIQSFFDKDLVLMNRSHNAGQAHKAIRNSKEEGFSNISIDLIYGIPGQGCEEWGKNIDIVLESGIQHISAYHLTYEPGTVFTHWIKKGRMRPVEEEESLKQFELLIERTSTKGFEHYEISNFALPGYISKHNSNYWNQVNYIGFGPSAHSYNGITRRWNISSNIKYMQSFRERDDKYFDIEDLTIQNLYNEYMLTSLRTSRGADLEVIASGFGIDYVKYTEKTAIQFLKNGTMVKSSNRLKLSHEGIFIADFVISKFICV